MPLIDFRYVKQRTALELTADLESGWVRKPKTYGYSERVKIGFACDYTIPADVTVLPRPSGFEESAKTFPRDAESSGGNSNISYRIHSAQLTAFVLLISAQDGLNPDLPWIITSTDKLAIRWVVDPIARQGPTHFELQLWLRFHPPPRAKPADIRDWERRFFPGGLPSLGKRR
ncbi:MAG: hypothetical protein ACHP78_05380 [Terriglobales bacterium]